MNPTAIYSKSGKGVQEASGKTSLLKRPDRAVLSAIDGRATLNEVAEKVGRTFDAAFQAVVQQLDKEGFIRAVSGAAASEPPSRPPAPPSRPAGPPSRPAAPPSRPSGPPSRPAPAKGESSGGDLDFSSLGATRIGGLAAARPAAPAPRPAAAPPTPQQVQQTKAQQSALDKAREEAEAKAAADRERVRKEAEDKAKAEIEAKMRADAEKKMKEEAEARAKAEVEAKVKAAREAALRAAAEAKAKAEADAKAKLELERKVREEMERRLEAERKAKEEAERKAQEAAERVRRELEEKARREAEELKQRLEEERKAREEAERKAKEEAERARRAAEEKARLEEEAKRQEAERKAKAAAERKAQEEAERKAKAEAERKAREEAERQAKEQEEQLARAAAEALASAEIAPPPPPKAEKRPAKPENFADSLLADLDSFTNKDEEEHKARAEAEHQARAEAQRKRLEAEQQMREEAQRREEEARRREEEQARRREEEKRKAREEEERIAREEERRKREAEEIQRKAEAATAAAMAKQAATVEEDIPFDDDDLDMTEVKDEQKALGIDDKKLKAKEKQAEKEAKKRKKAEEKKRRADEKAAAKAAAKAPPKTAAPSARPRAKGSWGRPVALFLGFILVAGIVAVHFLPLEVAEVEQLASQTLGQPVRIGSARLWLFTGPQLRFENVRVGEARLARVSVHPALASLMGDRQKFSLIEIEGVSLPQAVFGSALFSRLRTDRFSVERIQVRELNLPGPLALPKPLEAEFTLNANGTLRLATVRGPDTLYLQVLPKGESLQLDGTAGGLPLPIAPDIVLSQFAMKGTATRFGVDLAEWGGAIYNGAISGTAKVRWGSSWDVDGALTVRNINGAVFAPALLSEGKAQGTGQFWMSGADPMKLLAGCRFDGRFSINQGTLGSFDLSRAIQTRGKQVSGTTQFADLNGQVTYERGTVSLRNVTIGAGALNAGASAEITKGGALSGRIIADVRTPAQQTLSATLLLGGTIKEPQVRD